jgi:hypothetical protein
MPWSNVEDVQGEKNPTGNCLDDSDDIHPAPDLGVLAFGA